MRVLVPFTASRKSTSSRYCASCPRIEKRLATAAAAWSTAPLAEQIAEQIAEAANVLEARSRAIARAVLAAGIFAVIALLRPLLAARVDLAAVVAAALLLVADDVVGGGDLS